jgi:hypothetical protein
VPELMAEKPTEESVDALRRTLSIVSTIGSVCELPAVSKFFNGNPVLSNVGGGIDGFSGRSGRKSWSEIAAVIERSWDGVVDAIDGVVTTPDVDEAASEKAAAELLEPAPEPEEPEADESTAANEDSDELVIDDEVDTDEESEALAAAAEDQVLGSDEDFWAKVGIDPVRLMTGGGTYYTLRCYLGDVPVFLGRNGRISVFGSERAMARYLADEHDHDLADLTTYADIRTAATDGSLHVDVTDDNIYVLSGLADDIGDGPDAVDHDQLELAVELVRDVGDYAEDTTVGKTLDGNTALAKLVNYVLDPSSGSKPSGPYTEAARQWEELERIVESRLRPE